MSTELRAATPAEIRRGRLTLIGLAALFFLPLFAAFALYYAGGWRPAQATNHGELISPAVPLGVDWAREEWSLVYVGDGACDEACRQTLLVMRQTRLGLANEMTRVQRVFLATANCCDREFFRTQHVGMEVFDAGSDARTRALVPAFPIEDREHSLYIVDPLGNLMMRFDARQNPKNLLTDLKKLLKLSHIG